MKKNFFFKIPETKTVTAETVSTGTPPPAPAPASPAIPFMEMHLEIGNKVSIENLSNPETKERVLATVVGWLEGGSFVVTIPQNMAQRGLLKQTDKVLLRTFTGKNAFSFHAVVLKIEHFPFTYLHLSFPDKVGTVQVRHTPRHKVHFPIKIVVSGGEDVMGHILDIGMSGARVDSTRPFTGKDTLRLVMQFELHDVPMALELEAQVRSSKEVSREQGATSYEYGVEFQNLRPNDRLLLSGILWHEMQARLESE